MIASGEKKEEYREGKEYWRKRLTDEEEDSDGLTIKPLTHVQFRHGYGKNAPIMKFEIREISWTYGFRDWGAEPGKKYFVIKLGDRIES